MFNLFRNRILSTKIPFNNSLNLKTTKYIQSMQSLNENNEEVSVVDKDDNVIRKEIRKNVREQILIHRATYIFILNSNNKFHVHKRTMLKKWCPGFWDIVSGGMVQYGETYEENAERELEEEFGLKVLLKPLFKFYFENSQTKIWGKAFLGRNDGPLKLQKEEVERVELMSQEEIEERRKKGENFTPDGYAAYEMFLKENCFIL